MHTWGTRGVDWDGISDAAHFVRDYLVKWGRIGVRDYKEKWGTVRVYCDLGWHSLLSITHPGYVHYGPYPKWLMSIDIWHLSRVVPLLNRWVVPIHEYVYKMAYLRAVQKWPHLAEELLNGADFPELLCSVSEFRVVRAVSRARYARKLWRERQAKRDEKASSEEDAVLALTATENTSPGFESTIENSIQVPPPDADKR